MALWYFPLNQYTGEIVDVCSRRSRYQQSAAASQRMVGIVFLQHLRDPDPLIRQRTCGTAVHISARCIRRAVCPVRSERKYRCILQPGNARSSRQRQLLISSAKTAAAKTHYRLTARQKGQ